MLSNRSHSSFSLSSSLKENQHHNMIPSSNRKNLKGIDNGHHEPQKKQMKTPTAKRTSNTRRALGDISNRKGNSNNGNSMSAAGPGKVGLSIPPSKSKSVFQSSKNSNSIRNAGSLRRMEQINDNNKSHRNLQYPMPIPSSATKQVQFSTTATTAFPSNTATTNTTTTSSSNRKFFSSKKKKKSLKKKAMKMLPRIKTNFSYTEHDENNDSFYNEDIELPAGRLWSEEPDSDDDISTQMKLLGIDRIREDWDAADEARCEAKANRLMEEEEILQRQHELALEENLANISLLLDKDEEEDGQHDLTMGADLLANTINRMDISMDELSLGVPTAFWKDISF